ncbi:low-density lipoprotein receptor class A domain-containing protein 2 [Clupea harengus]|uniref:Low-density lipoprotein receptor class A domain-containing protein 2 n=1 Tax=Clupea harengus TaxID=7950 RepID=A0A6P3VQI4_CLUHA|nr:low-density lipoprotein receptor class A domain-containing protein 2 [Clupea harengus]
MAKLIKDVQHVFKLFVVISVMTFKPTSAIETVNVVDFCGQTIHGDGLIINSHQESKKYYFVTMGTDCHFTMQANMLQERVLFHFRFFLVYSLLRVAPLSPPSPLFPESASDPSSLSRRPVWPDHRHDVESTSRDVQEDPCYAGSYIQFYDGPSKNSPPIGLPLCGKSPPQPVLSTGNYLTLRLVTRGTQPRVDFVGDFTSFRLGSNQSGCGNERYFSCWNGKCIPMSLVCDDDRDIDNCGDGSDLRSHHEALCTSHQSVKLSPRQSQLSFHRIVALLTSPQTQTQCQTP